VNNANIDVKQEITRIWNDLRKTTPYRTTGTLTISYDWYDKLTTDDFAYFAQHGLKLQTPDKLQDKQ
jgi:hypothetical protein